MDATTVGRRWRLLCIGHGSLSRTNKADLGWQRVRIIQKERATKGDGLTPQLSYTPKGHGISVITATFLFAWGNRRVELGPPSRGSFRGFCGSRRNPNMADRNVQLVA